MTTVSLFQFDLYQITHERTYTFDDVYKETFDIVWRLVKRQGVDSSSIDDVVQDIFIAVNRQLIKFNYRCAIKTWVCGIAFGMIKNYRRSKKRKGAGSSIASYVSDPEDLIDDKPDQHDTCTRAQANVIVNSILSNMDEDKAAIFALVELEDMTLPEAAEILRLNVNTAYYRIKVARQDFESLVQKYTK